MKGKEDANLKKNHNQKKCVVLGLLLKQNKILLVQTPRGKIYLPGGESKIPPKQREKSLQKNVYKKTGIEVRIGGLRGLRWLNGKKIFIYDLAEKPSSEKAKKNKWQQSHRYQAFWLTTEEIEDNKAVTNYIKTLINDLLNEPLISIKALA